MVLSNTALFISLYKFFSKSFLIKVLYFVFSSYNRVAVENVRDRINIKLLRELQYAMNLRNTKNVESTLLQITYDITLYIA